VLGQCGVTWQALFECEKMLKQYIGVDISVVHVVLNPRGRSSILAIRHCSARLPNRPAEGVPTYLSCDGKGKVRLARAQLFGMKEFEKYGKEILGGIIASERRKVRGDLARGAMNGRNEDQKQEALPHRAEGCVATSLQKIEKDFIGSGISFVIHVVVKCSDEFKSGRKRGQYGARESKQSKLFPGVVLV
jgi:hypothetical protein